MEIQRAVGASANISHLNSILALKKRRDFDGWLAHLKEALQIQLKSMQGQAITYGFPFETFPLKSNHSFFPFIFSHSSPSYYILFDPEFILSIIRNYIESDIWQQLPPGKILLFM